MKTRRYALICAMLIAGTVCLAPRVSAGGMGSRLPAPRVEYKAPANESTVDMTGKDTITFSWKQVPIPAGGREAYRIRIVKEPGPASIFKKDLDERTFSVDVPASLFEDGCRYSWYVRQRDGRTLDWSIYNTWSFTAVKKR